MTQKSIVAGFLILAWVSSGCRSVAVPYLQGDTGGGTTWNKDETPKQYCRRLTADADSFAQSELGWGIVMGLLAGGLAVTGAAIGPDTDASANWAARNRNTLVLGLGALLVLPATLLLTRSKDANSASATAGQALGGTDDADMLRQCLAARSALVNSRSELADVAAKNAPDRLQQYQGIIDKAIESKRTATDEAGKKAADELIKATQARMASELLKEQ